MALQHLLQSFAVPRARTTTPHRGTSSQDLAICIAYLVWRGLIGSPTSELAAEGRIPQVRVIHGGRVST